MMLQKLARPRNLILLGTGLTTAYAIRQNDYSLSDIGFVRFTRAGITAAKMMVDYKIVMSKTDLDPEIYRMEMSACHKRSADRILDLCRANGGVFIKVGQHIASLQYLLPIEYTSTLSILHSQAPESNMDEVKQVFRESLGKEVSGFFRKIIN